jgi:hypothetical protein
MVVFMTALSLWGGFSGSAGNIAHFAHLGGFLGAYIYLRWLGSPRMEAPPLPKSVSVTKEELDRWERIDRSALHEVNREELDRIRAKMQSGGPTTLTDAERQFLNRFSA